ncbi:MAG: hypothetical protein QXW10_01790 [Candidatus Micrarchaeaceae archaeon]
MASYSMAKEYDVLVQSSDGAVKQSIEQAIGNVTENSLGNALLTECNYLTGRLRRLKHAEKTDLSIEYSGKSIKFGLELQDFDYFAGDRLYASSNESYSISTVKDMGMLEGIRDYIGISGGLTQVLTQIAVLQARNDIRTVSLCDINQKQLVYNALELARYDSMPSSFNLVNHIDFNNRYMANIERANYKRIGVGKGTRFELVQSDFREMLDNAVSKSRKFLYSSNVYQFDIPRLRESTGNNSLLDNCWYRWGSEQEKLMDCIASSSVYGKGSVLMAASPDSDKALLMVKERNGLHEYSYCSSAAGHENCVHPSLRR